MKSCIYEGTIKHSRKTPVLNEFLSRVYFMFFDLEELDKVFRRRLFWSTKRFSFARFDYRDHLKDFGPKNKEELRESAISVLRENGINCEIGPVRLLTQLRYCFFVMNPVSFYYCYGPSGERLEAVIAEVNNTPWGEQHLYVIGREQSDFCRGEAETSSRNRESRQVVRTNNIDKAFHVSPFMSSDMKYNMSFNAPADLLGVSMANIQNEEMFFNVSMQLEKRPISTLNLMRCLTLYPLMSAQIFAGIYWQALKLYWKKCPFYSHPGKIKSLPIEDVGTDVEQKEKIPTTHELLQ